MFQPVDTFIRLILRMLDFSASFSSEFTVTPGFFPSLTL
jgi:hypothetical protein